MKTNEWKEFKALPAHQISQVKSALEMERQYGNQSHKVYLGEFLYPKANDELDRKLALLLEEMQENEISGNKEKIKSYLDGLTLAIDEALIKIESMAPQLAAAESEPKVTKELSRISKLNPQTKITGNDLFFLLHVRLSRAKQKIVTLSNKERVTGLRKIFKEERYYQVCIALLKAYDIIDVDGNCKLKQKGHGYLHAVINAIKVNRSPGLLNDDSLTDKNLVDIFSEFLNHKVSLIKRGKYAKLYNQRQQDALLFIRSALKT